MKEKMKKKRIWYPRCRITGKVKYPSDIVADEVREKFIRKGIPDPGLNIYFCFRCYGYHLGSSTRSLARQNGEASDKGFGSSS